MKALHGAVCAVFVAMLLCASASPAHAALQRPNATDQRVSAIPQSTLLDRPAKALVDPDRQAAAARLIRWKAPGWLLMVLAQILALAYFWRSGGAAAWRDRLRQSIRSEFFVRVLFGASLAAIARFAALLPDFYLYRVEWVMGLSAELSRAWVIDWVLGLLGAMLLSGLVAGAVLWLADRTHQWYIYTLFGFIAISLALAWGGPAVIEPIFNHYAPMQMAGRPQVGALLASVGMADLPIVVEDLSQRAQTQGARADGLWSSRRIVVADTLVAGSTPQELNWIVALEVAHVADGDLLRRALLQALILILGAGLGVFAADRIGFRRDDDPVSRLALVGAIFGCAFFLAVPAYNVGMRAMEAQADVSAAKLTRDPSAGIRALVRTADENLEEVEPGSFATLYFGRAPAIAERVSALNGKI
ncbi:MAG: M48 family metalloprotease [Candidatus Eremiobacteraeota bacterium]|nr:M48 family metalloprotease [Candidatus Eremiobacteraeota bacterium]